MSTATGARTRKLLSFLRQRARAQSSQWPRLDDRLNRTLVEPRAVVFTDTADFTVRTARDGILHFLMMFQRILDAAPEAIRRQGGRVVKAEGDSLLLDFPDPAAACGGTLALDTVLRKINAGRPARERLKFSYGIGYGEVLWLEHDLFGLEVNLASKLGEDLARPGEALLTPAAIAALPSALRRKLVPYRTVPYGGYRHKIHRLPLSR
jgi:adenylate cyclase